MFQTHTLMGAALRLPAANVNKDHALLSFPMSPRLLSLEQSVSLQHVVGIYSFHIKPCRDSFLFVLGPSVSDSSMLPNIQDCSRQNLIALISVSLLLS